jgi:uncharacterized membrane protein
MGRKEKEIFNASEQHAISHAVSLAENRTSGEIRICVERECEEDAFDRAAYYFDELGMSKTALQNGVLIYLAVDDKKFAIIGDKGINAKVPEGFWDKTKDIMTAHFREKQVIEGIVAGIQMAGDQLKHYFPVADDDINELPNEVVQF